METSPRLLVLGAHPDDADVHAGGLIARHRKLGHEVKMVSVTDGAAGHHTIGAEELSALRREEAAAAGRVVGAAYEVWDFPDGHLVNTLDLRYRIIAEIRRFAPDLVLTHRTCDYHPDHRAVGEAVQDATFLVRVPKVVGGWLRIQASSWLRKKLSIACLRPASMESAKRTPSWR